MDPAYRQVQSSSCSRRSSSSALASARLGLFLEQHRERLFVEQRHRAVLREQVPNQARYLDRTRTPGRLVKPWNLVVPEYERAVGSGFEG